MCRQMSGWAQRSISASFSTSARLEGSSSDTFLSWLKLSALQPCYPLRTARLFLSRPFPSSAMFDWQRRRPVIQPWNMTMSRGQGQGQCHSNVKAPTGTPVPLPLLPISPLQPSLWHARHLPTRACQFHEDSGWAGHLCVGPWNSAGLMQ